MIHLINNNTNKSFCGKDKKGEVLTKETIPNRNVKNLCINCAEMYNKQLDDERYARYIAYNNRPIREKVRDCLESAAHFGESDMALISDTIILIATLGMAIPAKHIAKAILKLGI